MAGVTEDTHRTSTAVAVPTNPAAEGFFSFSAETSQELQHLLEFLNDKDMLMLNPHPEIKKIFLRYNTSAPVERLFSTAALADKALR